jgi:hypothetical protein
MTQKAALAVRCHFQHPQKCGEGLAITHCRNARRDPVNYASYDDNMLAALTAMLGTVIDYCFKGISGLIGFASFPTLQVKQTSFGWRDLERTRLVLLVRMRFRNNSQRPFVLNTVEVEFAGEWLKPIEISSEHFMCLTEKGWLTESLKRVDNVMASLQIPACDVVDRFALFNVPVATARQQNDIFKFTLRANFPWRRRREESFVIRNRL